MSKLSSKISQLKSSTYDQGVKLKSLIISIHGNHCLFFSNAFNCILLISNNNSCHHTCTTHVSLLCNPLIMLKNSRHHSPFLLLCIVSASVVAALGNVSKSITFVCVCVCRLCDDDLISCFSGLLHCFHERRYVG